MIQSLSALSSLSDKNSVFGVPQLGLATPGAASATPAGAASGFGDLLTQIASHARDTVKAGEAAAISGIQGKASTQSVVEAVMSAEQSLQTAVAIRDKVVAAYQEIVRMAI
ncbi:MAG: flagellar hook-basal body complex protein FliE [Microvirga sp.]